MPRQQPAANGGNSRLLASRFFGALATVFLSQAGLAQPQNATGQPVRGLPGGIWADANSDGRADGYIYQSQYYPGAPWIDMGLTLLPLTAGRGVLIGGVSENSSASKLGLSSGQIIRSINKIQVTEPVQVIAESYKARKAGREIVLLLVQRPGSPAAFVAFPVNVSALKGQSPSAAAQSERATQPTQAGELSYSNAAFTTPTDQIGSWWFYSPNGSERVGVDKQSGRGMLNPGGFSGPGICKSYERRKLKTSYDEGLRFCGAGGVSLGGCLGGMEFENPMNPMIAVHRGLFDWPLVAVTTDRKNAYLFCYRQWDYRQAHRLYQQWSNLPGGMAAHHPGMALARKYCEVMSHRKCDTVYVDALLHFPSP
jgi:hypothetical protein